jgi:hypothetical protein
MMAGAAGATTYYVDIVNGLDTNAGTSEAPWQTIPRAMANSASTPKVTFGDTVKIRDGNYPPLTIGYSSPAASSWSDKITYTSDDGHNPELEYIKFYKYRFYIELNNLKIRPLGGSVTKGLDVVCNGSLRFIDLDCEGANWNTDFNEWEDPNTGVKVITEHMFYFWNPDLVDCPFTDDITIQGCTISKCERGIAPAVRFGDEHGDWVIEDNEIHTIAGSPIVFTATVGSVGGHVSIKGNNIHDYYKFQFNATQYTHCTGIALAGVSNATIENNIVHALGDTSGISTYPDNYPVDFKGFNNMLIQNNLIYDVLNTGWALRCCAVGDGSYIVRNNTVIGHEYQTGVGYYGTSLYVSPYGYNDDPCSCPGLKIYNNIFVGMVDIKDGTGGLDEYSEDYNYIYALKKDSTNYLPSHDHTVVATTDVYSVVFDVNFFVDPCFAASMHRINLNDEFKLLAGSPAVNFGDSNNAPILDLLGNARIGEPDAGCYEYQGVPDPNNHAPVLAAIGNRTVRENQMLTITASATDVDDDELAYYWVSWGGIVNLGTTFTWQPSYTDAQKIWGPGEVVGERKVTCNVWDGLVWDWEMITITVTNAPQGIILGSQ